MKRTYATVASVGMALTLLAAANSALACTCVFEEEAKRFKQSDAAVLARLTEVVPLNESGLAPPYPPFTEGR